MNTPSMKLSTRLGLAFLAMVLLTMTVGGFAISRLAQVNARTTEEMALVEGYYRKSDLGWGAGGGGGR